jgi:hypothetical protein
MTQIAAYPLPDFCKAFGVGRSKAYEEIRAGRLKARKSGVRTIITAEDAKAWLESLPPLNTGRAAA